MKPINGIMLFSCPVLFGSLYAIKMETNQSGGFWGGGLSVEHLGHF